MGVNFTDPLTALEFLKKTTGREPTSTTQRAFVCILEHLLGPSKSPPAPKTAPKSAPKTAPKSATKSAQTPKSAPKPKSVSKSEEKPNESAVSKPPTDTQVAD